MTEKSDLPNLENSQLDPLDWEMLAHPQDPRHPPRILLLYGSVREHSYSRAGAEEGARILQALGCETKTFDPSGLPLPDDAPDKHPKVAELRELVLWCEGMVWSSPERHGAMTGIMKTQIDWIPLAPIGGVRPTQGKTLAVMQVCGGSQSFNAVNQLRILGRWMRLITIPNQSSIPAAWNRFKDGRLEAGSHYDRIVDVMQELARFTIMTRHRAAHLTDRYSERVEDAKKAHERVSKL